MVAFTSRAGDFSDVMDVIFVTHLVERLTRLVDQRRDVRMIAALICCSHTQKVARTH